MPKKYIVKKTILRTSTQYLQGKLTQQGPIQEESHAKLIT